MNLRPSLALWRGVALCGALLLTGTTTADETDVWSGTVTINETQFGLIVSGSFGGGTLTFKGKEHPFKTKGLGVGGVGVAHISAQGDVFNLTDISQFAGVYSKARAGFALGDSGKGGLILENEHKVRMRLNSTQQGAALTLGADGVVIQFDQ